MAQLPNTILIETVGMPDIYECAGEYGFEVIQPGIYETPVRADAPKLRFAEFAVIDPDNHVVSFFQYVD